MAHSWYDVFKNAESNVRPFPGSEPASRDSTTTLDPEALARLGPESKDALSSLLVLQSDTVERLVRDNERLMDRVEKLLQIQEREQALRLQMQDQVMVLASQVIEQAANTDAEKIIRETRKRLTAEIRPVLLALVEAMEKSRENQPLALMHSDRQPDFSEQAVAVRFRCEANSDHENAAETEPSGNCERNTAALNDLANHARCASETANASAETAIPKGPPGPCDPAEMGAEPGSEPEARPLADSLAYELEREDQDAFLLHCKLPRILMVPLEDLDIASSSQGVKSQDEENRGGKLRNGKVRGSRLGLRFFGGK